MEKLSEAELAAISALIDRDREERERLPTRSAEEVRQDTRQVEKRIRREAISENIRFLGLSVGYLFLVFLAFVVLNALHYTYILRPSTVATEWCEANPYWCFNIANRAREAEDVSWRGTIEHAPAADRPYVHRLYSCVRTGADLQVCRERLRSKAQQ